MQNTLADLKTYLSWRVLDSFAPFDAANAQPPRWKRCAGYASELLGGALGRKYVEKTLTAVARQRARTIVEAIENAMQREIEGMDSMPAEIRKQTVQKLRAVVNKVGYPDKWKDDSAVEVRRDDFAGNVIRLREWAVNQEVSKIGRPAESVEWGTPVTGVEVRYDPHRNEIEVPAGILQSPLFSRNGERAWDFAGIGAMVGQELTRDWWDAAEAKQFDARRSCPPDVAGVRLALAAFLNTQPNARSGDAHAPQQRFFVSYGQMRCDSRPGEGPEQGRRVNGLLADLPEFQQAFSCKAASKARACTVW